jgi:hypothetical protein
MTEQECQRAVHAWAVLIATWWDHNEPGEPAA